MSKEVAAAVGNAEHSEKGIAPVDENESGVNDVASPSAANTDNDDGAVQETSNDVDVDNGVPQDPSTATRMIQ